MARRPAPRRQPQWLRLLWAAPCSLLGLLLGGWVLLAGGQARRVGHTLELALHRGPMPANSLARHWPFAAITLGHVILANSQVTLAQWRHHEAVHVQQYERLGPLFLLAYPAASLLALLRGGHPYRDNLFERAAFAAPPPAGCALGCGCGSVPKLGPDPS